MKRLFLWSATNKQIDVINNVRLQYILWRKLKKVKGTENDESAILQSGLEMPLLLGGIWAET